MKLRLLRSTRKSEGPAVRVARPLLYLSPVLVSLSILCVSVFAYSWSSTVVNLVCSIQDDSFYYFVPSWNASHGFGFTFGGEKTSGFQPLYELLLTASGFFCHSLESLMRLAINLNGWLFALTALVTGLALGPLVKSAFPGIRQSAVALSMNVAALSFICLHTVFFSSVTGKENALSALLLAVLIYNVFAGIRGASGSLLVGFLCGLLLLARIAPASLMYVAIAVILLPGWKPKMLALAACLSPLFIWGVIAHSYFGHVLPMSMLVKVSSPSHLSAYHSVKPGLQYLWESAKYSVSAGSRFPLLQLKAREGLRSTFQTVVMAVALALSLLGLWRCLSTRQTSRAVVALLLFDGGGILCNILFGAAQAGRSDDMYYTVWYLYDLPVLVAINCGFALAWLQSQLRGLRFDWAVTSVLALASVAYFADDVAWYWRLAPYSAADDAAFAGSWQVKELESATWFRDNVSATNPGYRVAAYSAGALGFYLFDHVVNLDGLANNSAGEAIMAGQPSSRYTNRIKPDYLIDICTVEKDFGNLERLNVLPFPQQGNFCIEKFVYQPVTSQ